MYADKHNNKLQEELAALKEEINKYDKDANFDELEDVMQLPNQKKIHKDLTEIKQHSVSRNITSISQEQIIPVNLKQQ